MLPSLENSSKPLYLYDDKLKQLIYSAKSNAEIARDLSIARSLITLYKSNKKKLFVFK